MFEAPPFSPELPFPFVAQRSHTHHNFLGVRIRQNNLSCKLTLVMTIPDQFPDVHWVWKGAISFVYEVHPRIVVKVPKNRRVRKRTIPGKAQDLQDLLATATVPFYSAMFSIC